MTMLKTPLVARMRNGFVWELEDAERTIMSDDWHDADAMLEMVRRANLHEEMVAALKAARLWAAMHEPSKHLDAELADLDDLLSRAEVKP